MSRYVCIVGITEKKGRNMRVAQGAIHILLSLTNVYHNLSLSLVPPSSFSLSPNTRPSRSQTLPIFLSAVLDSGVTSASTIQAMRVTGLHLESSAVLSVVHFNISSTSSELLWRRCQTNIPRTITEANRHTSATRKTFKATRLPLVTQAATRTTLRGQTGRRCPA